MDTDASLSPVELAVPAAPERLPQRTRRGIVVFALACAAISATCWIAATATGADVYSSPVTFWLFAIGASGPSLAALVAVLLVRRSPSRRVPLRAPWVWLPLAVILPAAPAIVAAGLLDPGAFGADAAAVIAGAGGPFAFLAAYLVAGPLAEEFGWRGYVQPRLRLRYGPFATALTIGVAWSIWHLPLFLLPGTSQYAMGMGSVQALIFFVATIPLSMTLLWLSEGLGGGVWAAIVGHLSVNVSLSLLPQPSVAAALVALGTSAAIAAIAWWRMRARQTS